MRVLVALCLALALAGCSTPPATAQSAQTDRVAFAALMVRDVGASAEWYARVFDLQEANRATSATHDVRILEGDGVLIELIELIPAPPQAPDPALGISKAGFEIADWDAQIAEWRASGVRFFNDRVMFDEALRMHNAILLDPDGNMIQVFARAD